MCIRDRFPAEVFVTQSWLNWTKKGEFHHKHEHPNSYLSGVFYINADPDKDKIYFYKSGYKRINLPTEQFNQFNSESWWFNVGTCDLVIFPSYLTHGVPPNNTNRVRKALGVNALTKGTLGDEETISQIIFGRYAK